MLEFRKATAEADLTNWQILDNTVVSFGRGNSGHIAINTGTETVRVRLQTSLPPGRHSGLVSGYPVTVDEHGGMDVTLEPQSLLVILVDS